MSPRANFPLAYHITWGTYGTRLHGDDRGTVTRANNQPGDPIIGHDTDWQRMESTRLNFPIRLLTHAQRLHIESRYAAICSRGNWTPVAIAAATDHVHAILTADVDGKDIRKWLKRWTSESLSVPWPLAAGETWWAECGSVKWIWESDYFDRAVHYVQMQRTSLR